jgi:hypothetical protein
MAGENEEFSVNIIDAELDTLMDDSKEIRFEKVFEWCLPRLEDDDSESLFDYQAARMRNYITGCGGWMDSKVFKQGTQLLQRTTLQGSMVLVLVRCLLAIDRLNRSFVRERSLMLYHRFKCQ